MSESRSYIGDARPHEPLSDAEVEKMISAVLQLMREVGVKFDPDPRVTDLVSEAGCTISSDGIVKFPEELVRESLDSAAKSAKLWNRPGSEYIEFADRNTILMAGVGCPNVIDLETGERRPSSAEDLATITRVADALANIDGVCLPCTIIEKANVYGEMDQFVLMAANTIKPLTYQCFEPKALEAAIEMAAAIRGGLDQLRAKPYFLHQLTPLPLYYFKKMIDQLFLCVENGIPSQVITMHVGGASAPVTIAGNMAHCFATDFAGMVLSQLIEKGSFCTTSSHSVFIDPVTANLGGIPEAILAEMARCQVSSALGLPRSVGMAGASNGRRFDQYSAFLDTLTMMQTVYSQPGYCWCIGLVDAGMAYSLHALLFCNELAGMVRRIWKGFRVDDDTLAVDVTRALGPNSDYLAEMHTATHCRTELYNTKYFRFTREEDTEEGSGKKEDLKDVIDKDLREILATHRPEPLPDAVKKQINGILKKFGAL